MPLIELNGVGLLVEEAGGGEPLVLVHGSWDDRQVWVLVEDDLAKSFRVISYDRRGHTGSEDSPEPGSRRDDEDDLAALIEAHGLAPTHLAANSFGASIALSLAARRPELVRSVCAHEPPLLALVADDPAVGQVGEGAAAVVSLIDRGEAEAGARLFVEEVAIGPGAWELMPPEERAAMTANAGTFVDELRDPDWAMIDLDGLAALSCPVLLTQGDQSPPFFAAIIARLAEEMNHARVTTIPGAGHVPHQTHPTEWVAVVEEFVRGSD
jgi:pimeloyl-ACP methyl ester carboxylesterase